MNTELIEKYDMLPRGARVLCAVSGGADSMCLLHWLKNAAEAFGVEMYAAHFNHCLRGDESERDSRFVERWCRENGVECRIGRGDVRALAAKEGLSIEEAARNARYEFLENCAAELSCDRIATAHNADDNAETVLLNLCRGAGAKGLSGIPPRRGIIIRPLLCETRAQIERYNELNGVFHVEDSTNETDDYTRNVLRHKVMPVMRGINPAFSAAVMRTAELMRRDEAALSDMADDFLRRHSGPVPAQALLSLPESAAARVLRKKCGRGLDAKHIDALLSLAGGSGQKFADVPGRRVSLDGGMLYFDEKCAKIPDIELHDGDEITLSDCGFKVKAEKVVDCKEVFKSFNIFFFHYDSICGSISLTSRREGDKIRLAHRGCTKSLKELLREARLPVRERDMTCVLRDEKGPVAVCGFGVAERCEAKSGDTVFRVEIIKINTTGDNYQK